MIQPLRTVHRRVFVLLAVVLPAILLVGLEARHPGGRLGVAAAQLPASTQLLRKSDTLWKKHKIRSEFYSTSDHPENIYVVFQPVQELNEPDLLLYWASNTPQGNALPSDARLVGSYRTKQAFVLPLNSERSGYLVLFSLAHHTVIDSARVEPIP
jgi:hypothetical protein